MWKRDEAVKPTGSAPSGPTLPTPSAAPPAAETARPQPNTSHDHRLERSTVNIGKSVVIKVELNGSEDLTI